MGLQVGVAGHSPRMFTQASYRRSIQRSPATWRHNDVADRPAISRLSMPGSRPPKPSMCSRSSPSTLEGTSQPAAERRGLRARGEALHSSASQHHRSTPPGMRPTAAGRRKAPGGRLFPWARCEPGSGLLSRAQGRMHEMHRRRPRCARLDEHRLDDHLHPRLPTLRARRLPRSGVCTTTPDTNRFRNAGPERCSPVRGQLWLTETGGVVKFGSEFPNRRGAGLTRAKQALTYLFRLAASNHRNHAPLHLDWFGGSNSARFDAGLVDRRGNHDPAMPSSAGG